MSFFSGVLRAKAYLCCFTQFTVDQPKLTVNGSVLSDTPNVRYLVALYHVAAFTIPFDMQHDIILKKSNCDLFKSLILWLRQGLSEPEFYGDLV